MQKLLFLSLLLGSTCTFAQNTNVDVYGEWLLDPGCSCEGAVFIQDSEIHTGFFSLKKEPAVSVGGLYIDPEMGLAAPFTFVAQVDAERIRGKVIESSVMTDTELRVDVRYTYDQKADTIVITQAEGTTGAVAKYTYYRSRDDD